MKSYNVHVYNTRDNFQTGFLSALMLSVKTRLSGKKGVNK